MLNAGNYRGRPVRAALGIAGTGNEQIAVEFEFVDPPGTRRTWYGFFTENTFDRTIEALRACGWNGNDLADFDSETPPEGFDQEVELVVQRDEYPKGSGQWRDRIAFVNSGGGLALKTALTGDQAKAFAQKMKGRIVALGKTSGRASTPAPRREPAKPAARPAAPARTAPPADDGPPIEHLDERARDELGGKADAPF